MCTNWVESEAYDGRWAIAVATDVSEGTKQYLFVVEMLVGHDAPVALEGGRASHMVHECDFKCDFTDFKCDFTGFTPTSRSVTSSRWGGGRCTRS